MFFVVIYVHDKFDPTLCNIDDVAFSWQSFCPLRCHVTVGNLQRRLRQCPGSIQRCLATAELCDYLIGFYRGVRVASNVPQKVRKFMLSNKTRLNRNKQTGQKFVGDM